MAMQNHNATLSYKGQRGIQTYRFWVTNLEQVHSMGGSRHYAKMYSHWYAKSYSPGPLQVTGRAPDQKDYENLAEFIWTHQRLMATSNGSSNITDAPGGVLPLMKLAVIRNENVSVRGWINSFTAGAKKDNVAAPKFSFEFFIVTDNHSRNANIRPSFSVKRWWSGAEVTGVLKPVQERNESDEQNPKDGSNSTPPGYGQNTDDEPGGAGGR